MGKNNLTIVTPDEAVRVIQSGDHVHLSSVATSPQCLVAALCRRGRAGELQNVHIHHLHTEGPAPYADREFEGIFQLDSFFVGANVRAQTQQGFADYIPVFLGETQRLYREGYLPCRVVMMQVSPPDEQGYVSLGTSVDATLAAMEVAETVIAVINPNVPRTFGDALISTEKIHLFVEDNTPLETGHFPKPDAVETAIGRHCAALIEDGATLQMGIGAIPNAVLDQLGGHKNLGIHTEMFADGVIPLVEKGVINGENKAIDRGKMVATFLLGSKKLYDYTHLNSQVLMMDVGYTNDPFIISRNPKVTAINSALQVDLTGQVCADSLGTKFYSGVGGQVDFCLRRLPFPGRQGDYRSAVGDGQRDQQNCTLFIARRRRRHHARACAVAGDGIRGRQSLRPLFAGAGPADHQHRAPIPSGSAAKSCV